ncbi:hypothetical protein [Haloferax sp. Q22]|uniref:hypothetical protein n=1 Tax=Haloferax sp. (strain Q22) TaxID=1526048 RepID=UPI0012FCD407|nr:hypothetical protein [Haloferax sp. Q22]
MERKDGVVQRVAREINNEVILASHPDFEIDTGLHPAGHLTIGRPIDMTLYIDLSNEFKNLYEIGELDSWINKYSRKIPVAGLEVQFHSPVREPAEWLEVASQLDGDIPRIGRGESPDVA